MKNAKDSIGESESIIGKDTFLTVDIMFFFY